MKSGDEKRGVEVVGYGVEVWLVELVGGYLVVVWLRGYGLV